MFQLNKYDVRLLINLFKMNLADRYLGSSLGRIWAILNPLFMLSLYTYIFAFILEIKLPGSEKSITYVIWLLSGLAPWMAISEGLITSANSVVTSAGLVKNVVFKTELLPINGALSGLVSQLVNIFFIIVILVLMNHELQYKLLLLPLMIGLQFLLIIGIGFWLSALTVFVRDVSQLLPNVLLILMFGTPIFYSFESLPNALKTITIFNPFYQITEFYRFIFIADRDLSLFGLLYTLIIAVFISVSGLWFFRKLKPNFDSAL